MHFGAIKCFKLSPLFVIVLLLCHPHNGNYPSIVIVNSYVLNQVAQTWPSFCILFWVPVLLAFICSTSRRYEITLFSVIWWCWERLNTVAFYGTTNLNEGPHFLVYWIMLCVIMLGFIVVYKLFKPSCHNLSSLFRYI